MDENITMMAEVLDEPKTEIRELKMTPAAEDQIRMLDAEIEAYRSQIAAAEGALDSAEKELNEVLSELQD